MSNNVSNFVPSFCGAEGNRSISDNGNYIGVVEKALTDYEFFTHFKQSAVYQGTLEHVSPDLGLKYLEIIAQQAPDIFANIANFRINDFVGGANLVQYGDVVAMSPSTLRYVKIATDIRNLFGKDLQKGRIAEIGVGYGGQMLVLDQIYRFSRYSLFDLLPVLNLAQKYLESHILNSAYEKMTLNQCNGDESYDLVISNYAFSELPSKLQRAYVDKVLLQSKRGYMIMNSGTPEAVFQEDKMSLDTLKCLLPTAEVIDETPLSFKGNYVLVWGHR